MTMWVLQVFLLLLIAFAVGAGIAWIAIRAMYRPVADVRSEFDEVVEAKAS